MSGLQYVGPAASAPADLSYRDYVTGVKTADLSVEDIDEAITDHLTPYVDKSYVDAQDALNATQAYIDAGDATRLKLADKNVANGVVGLDASSRLNPSLINAPLDQKWHRGPWTPSAYHSTPVTFGGTETTLFTCPVSDPGHPYKLLVNGMIEARSSIIGENPIINVRVGSPSGPIIATGRGTTDSYLFGAVGSDNFNYPGSGDLGVSFGADKWGSVSGTSPVTVSDNMVEPSQARRTSIWVGTDPASDRIIARWKIGATNQGSGAHRVFICSNDTGTNYCAALVVRDTGNNTHLVRIQTSNGSWTNVTTQVSSANRPEGAPVSTGGQCEFSYDPVTNSYTFVYEGNEWITWTDSTNIVTHGTSKRRAAIQTNANNNGPGFEGPGLDDWELYDRDPVQAWQPVSVVPVSLHATAALTGATTLYVTGVRSGSAATFTVSTYSPRLHVMAIPA